MEKQLSPCPLGGTVAAISSKSHAHRLAIAAALADRQTRLFCDERALDLYTTLSCLRSLNQDIARQDSCYTVQPRRPLPQKATLYCAESGATLRFLLPVVAALGINGTFYMRGRLPERPIKPLTDALAAHGCTITRPTADTLRCEGQLRAGTFLLPGDVSSQFVTGLLLALPLLPAPSDIMLTSPCVSRGYINLTLSVLRTFRIDVKEMPDGWHISPSRYRTRGEAVAEGDWSNAAFWLCAGAISKPITVTGLSLDSLQGDRRILSLLEQFGAVVTTGKNSVTVCPKKLHGICIDVSDTPDLAPPLALLATCAEGETLLTGAARLRDKESDRLQSIADALNALGGSVEILPDALRITGGRPLRGGMVESRSDHRIAMLGAIAASVCKAPVTVLDADATDKSDRGFWLTYKELQQEERR